MKVDNRIVQFVLRSLAVLLLGLNASAQADYHVGDTIELNTIGLDAADHAAIAVNSFGDVIIVNHTQVGQEAKATELNTLVTLGNTMAFGYKLFNTRRVGDPNLNIFGVGNDSCSKPDIEALGDDSFLVVWSRHDLSGTQPSRIEACKIITRDSNGSILPQVDIVTPRRGEGIILDSTSNAGDSGFMPDIASFKELGSTKAIIVFAHEQSKLSTSTSTYRDYSLMARKIDWPRGSSSPSIHSATTIETDIPFDNTNSSPYHGGIILPDAVLDDGGNLTVVYESYLIAPHNWHFGTAIGSIQLRRYSPQSLALLDEIEFRGHHQNSHQRRPMIATSNDDAMNMVAIGWNDSSVSTTSVHRVHFRRVDFNTSAPGHSPPQVVPWDETFSSSDDLANVAMSGKTGLIMASRHLPNRHSLNGAYKLPQQPVSYKDFAPANNHPWRPAMAIYDLHSSRSLSYLSYEGPSGSNPLLYSIYFTVQELQ
jgi:hypothetical protein